MQKVVPQQQVKAGFIKLFSVGFVFNLCVAFYFWDKSAADKNIGNSMLLSVPLILMVSYYWWYQDYAKQDESSRSQFADSLYFLGFLFTLMHLSFALIPWVFKPGIDSFYILAQFGMAITTTLAGLFLRVTMTQFRDGEERGIQTAQQAMGEAAAAFVAQLEISTRRLKEYHEQVIPYLEEQTNACATNMKKLSSDAIVEMGRSSTALGEATSKVTQKLTTKLDEVTHDFSEAAQKQVSITKKSAEDMTNDVRTICTTVLASFKELLEQALVETRSTLEKLKWTISRVDTQLTNKMQALGSELDQSTEAIKAHRERSVELLAEVNIAVVEDMKAVAKIGRDGLQVVVTAAVGSVEKVTQTSLTTIGGTAAEINHRWQRDLSDLFANTKTLLTGLNQSIENMQGSAQQMENANRSIVNMINDVLIKVINDVTDGISKLNEQTKTIQVRFEGFTNVMESFRPVCLVMEETTKAVENTNIAFQQINREASATHTQLQEELRRIAILREKLSEDLTVSTELTQQVHTNLVQGLRFVVKELGRPPQ